MDEFLEELKRKIESKEEIILHVRGNQRQGMSTLATRLRDYQKLGE